VELDLKDGPDRRGREDLLVYKVIEVSLETQEVLDTLDSLARLEIEGLPDQLELLVLQGVLVLRDCLVLLDRVQLDLLDHPDLSELLDLLDLLVKLLCLSLQLHVLLVLLLLLLLLCLEH